MRTLVLTLVLLASSSAVALAQQHTARVSVADLTVDDQTPPDRYRDLLATGLQPTLRPVLECYRERLVQAPSSQGTLRLRLWISAREVIRATEERSTLGDDTFDECARTRVRAFRLPDAAPDGGATVRFTLVFTHTGLRDAPVAGAVFASVEGPVPPPAPVGPPSPTPSTTLPAAPPPETAPPPAARASLRIDTMSGGLDESSILAALPATMFDACPAGTGERALTLSISRTGIVRASAARGTLRQRDLLQCVLRAVRAVRMPAARPATTATLTVSFAR